MDSKPTGFEEFTEIFFSTFQASFNCDLRRPKDIVCTNEPRKIPDVRCPKSGEMFQIVPDSFELKDAKIKRGEEIDSPGQHEVGNTKYKCLDPNILHVHIPDSRTSGSFAVAFTRHLKWKSGKVCDRRSCPYVIKSGDKEHK